MVLAHAIPAASLFAGRYRIVEKVAEGTVASVYRADDERGGFEVALKVFDPLRSADPIARLRFEREFAILSQVDHRGLARALRFERFAELDVLVMEYVEGDSLATRLARGRLEIDDALALMATLSRTLSDCHRAGVIHRDLKPSNVILHPQRGPVIVDFGVAWFSSALTLTRTGAIVGSPRYVAPETFRSRITDERADVYALGAILFEMLTGRPARQAESIAELAARGFLDPPPPSSLRPELPEWIDRVVLRALAARPEDRFATMGELGVALERHGDLPGVRLDTRLSCSACGVPSIVDLPICPGCGRTLEWSLTPGVYAVQLLEVSDPRATAAWLRRRHGEALRSHWRWLASRLARPPIPVAVGISRASADAICSSLRDLGARTEIVRARAVLGPPLAAPEATPKEIATTLSLHFLATAVAFACLAFAATPVRFFPLVPIAVSLLGLLAVRAHARRPLLKIRGGDPQAHLRTPLLERTASRLAALVTPRARSLAAAALARATPLFMATGAVDEAERSDATSALEAALDAALEVDLHARTLAEDDRALLRHATERAHRRADRKGAKALEVEQDRHAETALAHDLAARRVLEACETLTRALLPPRRLGE